MAHNITNDHITLQTKQVETADGTYTYTLSYEDSSRIASMGIRLYSISIEFINIDGVRGFAEAKECFADKKKAVEFFNRLVSCLATPLNLPYIIEDELFT